MHININIKIGSKDDGKWVLTVGQWVNLGGSGVSTYQEMTLTFDSAELVGSYVTKLLQESK